ncbi:MAG: sulfurtransferase [Cyanobacteria bacterium P01_A01_bin.105]
MAHFEAVPHSTESHHATDYPTDCLVNADWLAQHLETVVVFDCRFQLADANWGQAQYQQGHIPGAYYLDLNRHLSSPVAAHGGRHPLPNWGSFVDRLNLTGIQSQPPTPVVIYDDNRFAFAARLWWMLRYLGHRQVALLDGGWGAWQRGGYPTEQVAPSPRVSRFVPHPLPDWTVDIAQVRQAQADIGVLLIDSRAPARYRGEQEPIDPLAGAIPGAANAFWKDVTDEAGHLKSRAALAQHWSAVDDAEDVVVYCGSGVTACVNLFSLVAAGKPMGKLYPGGWSDWCSYLS